MLNLNLRMPSVALVLLCVLGALNFSIKRIPTLSGRAFQRFYALMVVNVLFEMGAIVSLCLYDSTPEPLRLAFHMLYIYTMVLVTYQFFVYVYRLCYRGGDVKKVWRILSTIPLIGSLGLVLSGQIEYYGDGTYVYSYGLMTLAIYISMAYYLVCVAIIYFSCFKVLNFEQRFTIAGATFIWVAGGITQSFIPTLLISNICGAIMVLFMYLSQENPKENYHASSGCFNRKAFVEIMEDMLSDKKRSFYVVTAVFDGMEVIKSRFGQSMYNKFLLYISEFMFAKSGERRPMAFNIDADMVTVVTRSKERAEKCAHALDVRFDDPVEVDGVSYVLGCRIFMMECPKHSDNAEGIISAISFFSSHYKPVMDSNNLAVLVDESFIEQQQRYNQIKTAVEDAIEHDGFQVFYQPIYSTKKKRFTSAEALIRLYDEKLGFISPEEFIPIAEQDRSILKVGIIVFEKVCSLASKYDLKGMGIEYIEVNLSGVQCMNNDLFSQLKNVIRDYRIDPSFVNLEITETSAVMASDVLTRNMLLLGNMGCSFSMDDFGTGYSNLSQILHLPLKIVKLDKSLVWSYFDKLNPKAAVLTSNIIRMIKEMNLEIVTEGVETKEQAEAMIAMGVDFIQGYYYSKPINSDDFIKLMQAQHSEAVQ